MSGPQATTSPVADPTATISTVTVNPGDLIALECPAGSQPKLQVGDAIKKDDQEMATVVDVQDNKVRLGPLRAGEWEMDLPCTPNVFIHKRFSLTPIETKKLADRSPPLAPQSFAYPVSLWVMIVIALLLLSWLGFWLRSKRKPQLRAAAAPGAKIKVDPSTDFKDLVDKLPRMQFADLGDSRELLPLYMAIYEKLRAFLDAQLHLNASIETTREFLVTFRAAALKFQVPQQWITQVEQLLLKCDDVRFAGEIPPTALRLQQLKMLAALFEAFRTKANAPGAGGPA